MADWTNSNLPPSNPAGSPTSSSDLLNPGEWENYINAKKAEKTTELQNTGTIPREQSVHGPWSSVEISKQISEEMFYAEGSTPSPWEKVDSHKESPDGKTDYTMWTRSYPSLTIKTYTKITLTYSLVRIAKNGRRTETPLQPAIVLWYLNETRTLADARVYFWEQSSRKDNAGHWVKVATPPSEVVPPGMPPGGTKLGNPKDELKTALAPLQIDGDGVHVAVALRVLSAETKEPLGNVVVEWDGETVGLTPPTGVLAIRRTYDRPAEPFLFGGSSIVNPG